MRLNFTSGFNTVTFIFNTSLTQKSNETIELMFLWKFASDMALNVL